MSRQSGCEALFEVLPIPTQLTHTDCIFFGNNVFVSDLWNEHNYGFFGNMLDQHK